MPYMYAEMVQLADGEIPRIAAATDTAPTSPEQGAVIVEPIACPAFDWRATALLAFAYACPDSRYHGDQRVLDLLIMQRDYAVRDLSPEGLTSLKSTNRHSPPDTGFAIDTLAPVLIDCRRRRKESRHAARVDDLLGPLVERMSRGMIGRGFHTPNHRWVVTGALSMAQWLFPDIKASDYIDQILAETVDINADGQYIERSTGVYNAIANRGLMATAEFHNRPDLLGAVRANLAMMTELFHYDGSVLTLFSARQDQGQRKVPDAMAVSYLVMGHRDGNEQWLAYADHIFDSDEPGRAMGMLLYPFTVVPELRDRRPAKACVKQVCTRHFPASGIWRHRDHELSLTVGSHSPRFVNVRYGEVELACVKVCVPYFGGAVFNADRMQVDDDGVHLMDDDANARSKPGFVLPLGKPVPLDRYSQLQETRERWDLPTMSMSLHVKQVKGGLDLSLKIKGGVPDLVGQFECNFVGPGIWETASGASEVHDGQSTLLFDGHGAFHRNVEAISVGPGSPSHRMWQMRNSDPEAGYRVIVPFNVTAEKTLEIRYGLWSPTQRRVVHPMQPLQPM